MITVGSFPDAASVRQLAGKRVLVVGDVILDAYIMGNVNRISPEAPVPVVHVASEQRLLGGAGNVARNIAALGGMATLVGAVGDDAAAGNVRQLLDNAGIRSALLTLPERITSIKTRVMARGQQMLRLDQENATPLDIQDLDALFSVLTPELHCHDVVILSDYNKGLVSAAFMRKLRELFIAESRPVYLLVDPKPSNIHLYTDAFILTPNAKETGECAGMPARTREEIIAAGRAILGQTGCRHLLTTLGAKGMVLFRSAKEVWHVPTMAQNVFDVTGAGDTVIATLGLGLAAGMDLPEACILANYAAGLVVAQVGAAVSSPDALIDALDRLPRPLLSRWV